nr:MAG TPA: hypothetical protein [Caudoviricetes sp.]
MFGLNNYKPLLSLLITYFSLHLYGKIFTNSYNFLVKNW